MTPIKGKTANAADAFKKARAEAEDIETVMAPRKAKTKAKTANELADELADVTLRKQLARRAPSWNESDPSAAGGYNPDINKRVAMALEGAYNHFNSELFSDKLPNCMISLQSIPARNGKATYGYFSNARFATPDGSSLRDAIALNPLTFKDRNALDILSTLAHEMTHCWQHHSGNPSRGYHDQKWAAHMTEIGLMPSDTGQIGGKQTGWQMTHYVIKGGRFEKAAKVLIAAGFKVEWYDRGLTKKQRGGGQRAKYHCPVCSFNVWGAAGGSLSCEHNHPIQRMEVAQQRG